MFRKIVTTAGSAAGSSMANSKVFAKTVGAVAERVNMTEVVHTVGHGAQVVSAVTDSALTTLDRTADRFTPVARVGMAVAVGIPTGVLAGSVYAASYVNGPVALLIVTAGVV